MQIDLDRHAIVAASAGTGKTYTIERLVGRLLVEKQVKLENVLLVTYTEKATGELKERLRKLLTAGTQQAQATLYQEALDSFDQAPIFTIHGFCRRLLTEYAFEQGQDLRRTLVNDQDLAESALREVQRRGWLQEFGANLPEILERANYNVAGADKWEKDLHDLVGKYRDEFNHILLPRPEPPNQERFGYQLTVKSVGDVRRVIKELKTERGLFSFDDMIINVDNALDPENPRSRHFINVLRERFRYAIVDEFQDTDPKQWSIFRRLFLEGGNCKLIVVGDPKQAIFGFRGADLPTYLKAAEEMAKEFGAANHPLDTNWRTVDELLQPLNRLFEIGNWFPPGSAISFTPVQAPAQGPALTRSTKDTSGRAPLMVVDLFRTKKLKIAQRQFGRFVVAEIERLLASDLEFELKRKPTKLNAGHICCLVFKRREADALAEALGKAGLPFTFYKQTGLWQSTEATHLGIILQALAAPEDRSAFRKALLTSFFRLSPTELALCEDIAPDHPVRQLFYKWLDFTGRRQWSALTQSLLEESGVLFDKRQGGSLDRRAGNFRYLLGTLEETAYRDNLNLLDLLEFYNARRQTREDPTDIQPIDTDQPKIKIMTIHSSKGLEFPIVFLAGGFTKKSGDGLASYRDEQGRRVYDLDPARDAKADHQTEVKAENQRLLYVALTRAMLKLYVPLVQIPSRAKGTAGPVATLLGSALREADLAQLGPRHAALVDPLTEKLPAVGIAKPAPAEASPNRTITPLEGPLFPVLDTNLGKRRLVVRSFTSLHRASSQVHFGEDKAHVRDEGPEVPDDPFRGPVFGEMVHDALEAIDFAAVGAAADLATLTTKGSALRAILDVAVTKHLPGLYSRGPMGASHDDCVVEVARLVWNALRTPLPGLGSRLADIPQSERIHELEFLFPQDFGAPAPAGVRLEEGFFTGFMDLVFRKNKSYYLLDWKTNVLDAYDPAGIARAMEQSDYHRQYRLYLQALKRWLEARHGKKFDFLKHCGGVYYLFLRGMTTTGPGGIFSYHPSERDLDLRLVTA